MVFCFNYFTIFSLFAAAKSKKDKQLALKTPFFEELESQIGNAGTRNFKKQITLNIY